MTPTDRKVYAGIAAFVMAACLFAYIVSFFGAQADKIIPWVIPAGFGWLVLIALIWMHNPSTIYRLGFGGFGGFYRGMPRWVLSYTFVLMAICILHFAWTFMRSGPGVPGIIDGQYVIESNGHILHVITEARYRALGEDNLRMIAATVIYFYSYPLAYFCFHTGGSESATPQD